jgi:hypothetical protein
MDKRDKKDIITEYERRHSFWSEQALNQLGYSLNLFFTLNLSFLVYLITERKNYPNFYFDISAKAEWKFVFYCLLLIFLFISLLIATSVIISRLYDLRITRFIIWVRKRTYKKHEALLSDKFLDFSKEGIVSNFLRTLFYKIEFIDDNDFKDLDILKRKFDELRMQGKLLGQFTWKMHRIHIVLILSAALMYGIVAIFT